MKFMLRVHAEGDDFILSEAGQPMEFESQDAAREVGRALMARETPRSLRAVIKDLIQVHGGYPAVDEVDVLIVQAVEVMVVESKMRSKVGKR